MPFLNFQLVYNQGASFGFLSGFAWSRYVFSAIAILFSLFVVKLLWSRPKITLEFWGWILVLSGALGNLWDRIAYGVVVDFIDFHLPNTPYHFPTFNLADTFITLGVIGLILSYFLFDDKAVAARKAKR